LATAATIIASQAIISGVFSMTRQAIQLGLCPRLTVTQTSATGYGQIYVGVVNWLLMVFTLGLTIGFGSSDKLAAAFGIAVSLTMLLTTILMYKLMREQWQWSLMKALAVAGPLLLVDCTFSSANLVKVTEGGWVPLAAAAIVFTIMDAWRSGRIALIRELQRNTTPMSAFINSMKGEARVQGTAVYLTQQLNNVPIALLHNVKHYHVLHWRNILLTVDTEHIPRVPPESRVHFVDLGHEFYNIQLHYGFMEHRDIPLALAEAMPAHAPFDLMNTTFFVSRASIERAPQKNRLNAFFRGLFTWLHRNESDATEFFHIPRNRMVELGTRVEV
jgi:KUP system potassium uptake protein